MSVFFQCVCMGIIVWFRFVLPSFFFNFLLPIFYMYSFPLFLHRSLSFVIILFLCVLLILIMDMVRMWVCLLVQARPVFNVRMRWMVRYTRKLNRISKKEREQQHKYFMCGKMASVERKKRVFETILWYQRVESI